MWASAVASPQRWIRVPKCMITGWYHPHFKTLRCPVYWGMKSSPSVLMVWLYPLRILFLFCYSRCSIASSLVSGATSEPRVMRAPRRSFGQEQKVISWQLTENTPSHACFSKTFKEVNTDAQPLILSLAVSLCSPLALRCSLGLRPAPVAAYLSL